MYRLVTPLFFLAVGIGFLVATLNLPKARLGDPNAPLYFPAMITILLVLLSVIYFFQEFKHRKEEFKELKMLLSGRMPFLIISTIVMIFIYTFLFERIGFLFSTMVFLGGLLFIINGTKKWLVNILVAVLFSGIAWYSFGILLKVSLP
jgi:putative tricarboxylic transport membrane protein